MPTAEGFSIYAWRAPIGKAIGRGEVERFALMRDGAGGEVKLGLQEGGRIQFVILSPDQIGTKNLALKFPRRDSARSLWHALGAASS